MSETIQLEALLRVFYANQGKLRGYIFSATRDYHATEDILQEIAIVVAKKAATFDCEREEMPWFMGIARNQIQRWYRMKGREQSNISFEVIEECIPMFESFGSEEVSNRRLALKRCVDRLPGKQKAIMNLRYIDEMDCSQIAENVGRSVQGIYAVLKRLKVELRKCVEFQLDQQEI